MTNLFPARTILLILVPLPLAPSLVGCGGGPTNLTGEVLLDDAPLAEGTILLVPADGNGQATGGAIKEGKFALTGPQAPKPGNYKVEVRASKKSGKQVQKAMGQPGEMVDELVPAVPPRFNSETTLTVEVKPGSPPAKFEVYSK